MWQQFYEKHQDRFQLLSVAVDAQGPEKPRRFVEQAKATFPVVVDQENVLAKLFNYKVVPNGIFVDEGGTLRYVKLGGFEIRKLEYAALTEAWINGEPALEKDPLFRAEASKGMQHPDALRFYDEGLIHYRAGRAKEAVALWRKVIEAEPDNFVVRKQIWAVEHPEKFYDGSIDSNWQKEQIAAGQ